MVITVVVMHEYRYCYYFTTIVIIISILIVIVVLLGTWATCSLFVDPDPWGAGVESHSRML